MSSLPGCERLFCFNATIYCEVWRKRLGRYSFSPELDFLERYSAREHCMWVSWLERSLRDRDLSIDVLSSNSTGPCFSRKLNLKKEKYPWGASLRFLWHLKNGERLYTVEIQCVKFGRSPRERDLSNGTFCFISFISSAPCSGGSHVMQTSVKRPEKMLSPKKAFLSWRLGEMFYRSFIIHGSTGNHISYMYIVRQAPCMLPQLYAT